MIKFMIFSFVWFVSTQYHMDKSWMCFCCFF